MATRQIKKTTTKSNTDTVIDNDVVLDVEKKEKKPRKYEPTTPIPCESITSGELGIIGIKSNINYRWANRGDVTDVEYQDLVAAIMSNKDAIMRPRFIVRDDEFVQQFPQLNDVYKELYSIRDLKDILRMPVTQMEATIQSLPKGVQESIEGLAATMIEKGQLDSVKTIHKLDEIFGSKFSLIANI